MQHSRADCTLSAATHFTSAYLDFALSSVPWAWFLVLSSACRACACARGAEYGLELGLSGVNIIASGCVVAGVLCLSLRMFVSVRLIEEGAEGS